LDRANGSETEQVLRAFAAAAKTNSPTGMLPFLEALFIAQALAGKTLASSVPVSAATGQEQAGGRFSPAARWEFPVDIQAAEALLRKMHGYIPEGNNLLQEAHEALLQSLSTHRVRSGKSGQLFAARNGALGSMVEVPASHAASCFSGAQLFAPVPGMDGRQAAR